MNTDHNTPWFRYQFTNCHGREFDTHGIGEKHDAEKGILEIDKGDGNTTIEPGVYKFNRTLAKAGSGIES